MTDINNQTQREIESQHDGSAVGEPVGYGRPPRRHQFKKGQSGNPRGRRKGGQNLLSIFKRIAREKVRVRIGGELRIMTRSQYVLYANYLAALKRNQKAMNNMFMLAEKGLHLVDRDNPEQVGRPISHFERLSIEDWLAASGQA